MRLSAISFALLVSGSYSSLAFDVYSSNQTDNFILPRQRIAAHLLHFHGETSINTCIEASANRMHDRNHEDIPLWQAVQDWAAFFYRSSSSPYARFNHSRLRLSSTLFFGPDSKTCSYSTKQDAISCRPRKSRPTTPGPYQQRHRLTTIFH